MEINQNENNLDFKIIYRRLDRLISKNILKQIIQMHCFFIKTYVLFPVFKQNKNLMNIIELVI